MSSRLDCDYGLHLIWEEDAFSSGRCHGRAGVWSKGSTSAVYRSGSGASTRELNLSQRVVSAIPIRRRLSVLPQAFLNTTFEDMRLYHQSLERGGLLNQDENSGGLSIFNLGKPWTPSTAVSGHSFPYLGDPQPQLSLFPSSQRMSEDERTLMDYYKSVVCLDVTHIRRDEDHDPRQFFLWRATESRVVCLAVLMSSATFLERHNSRFVVIALQYRQRVLRVLRDLLKMGDARATEIILIAMMLCSSEVSSNFSVHAYKLWLILSFGEQKRSSGLISPDTE